MNAELIETKSLIKSNDNYAHKPHYHGHRQRMKEKFLNGNGVGFSDYEMLELLLFQAIPRRDVRPLAKSMLDQFGTLNNIIHSDTSKLERVDGLNLSAIILIKAMREIMQRSLNQEVKNENVISSWSALLNYLKFSMGQLKVEQFRVLFLNKKNILICDEVIATGTIDQTAVYPREIIKRALFHEAGALILVHNHPSGNTQPSRADIELTKEISKVCSTVNVTLHDHVIIGKNNYYSFKSNLLI